MIKMMMAMGAASVMNTVVLAGTASLALYGMQAVMSSSRKQSQPPTVKDQPGQIAKAEEKPETSSR